MEPTIEILLVDGVGRPKIVEHPGLDLLPFMQYARDHVQGQARLARFECSGEVDADLRPIYRLVDSGVPEIRTAYLTLQPIGLP
jgi:hypothetical protein